MRSRQGMPTMNYCDTVLYGLRQQRRDTPSSMSAERQYIEESAKKKHKRTNQRFCSICEKFNHNTKDCYKNQVDGVSGDINYDLGAKFGEKLEENAEAPV